MWSDGRSNAIYDRCGTSRDSDIGAWKRRWTSFGNRCSDVMRPIGSFDMPFVRHPDEVLYVRKQRASWLQVDELPGVDLVKGCCIPRPFDQFYLVKEASAWWCELDLERRRRVNVREPRFIGWHNLKMFALPSRERDLFFLRRPQVWEQYETPRALGALSPVVYSYFPGESQNGAPRQKRICTIICQSEYIILALGAFLRTVCNGGIGRLAFDSLVEGCRGYDTLLPMPDLLVEQWFSFGLLRCIRDMAIEPVMAMVAVACVAEIDWSAQPEQEWFPFNYEESSIVRILAVALVRRQQADGTVVEERRSCRDSSGLLRR